MSDPSPSSGPAGVPGYDAIVVGSGIGGLTFASLMAQLRGMRVLVLERHFKLGGFTHAFKRPGGYTWDVGVHYVGEMAPGSTLRGLMDLATGGGVDWMRMPSPHDVFVYPDLRFEVPAGREAFGDALGRRFPGERAAIARYLADVTRVGAWYARRILAQGLPAPVRRLVRGRTPPHADRTTREYLDLRFRDPLLRTLLASTWGAYGLPPGRASFVIHAVVAAHFLDGGYYPVGGGGALARHIVPRIEAPGGRCLVNHEVREIVLREGVAVGVRALARRGSRETAVEFAAPLIVSGAGAHATFCRLLAPSAGVPFRAEVEALPPSASFVTLYVGLNESPARLGFRGENHWIFVGQDHDALHERRDGLLDGRPIGCYLSFPSLKDPLANAHTAVIMAALDYEAVRAWRAQPWRRRDEAYREAKARASDALLDLVEGHYPGFRGLVAFHELSTPVTVEHFSGHHAGAVYGLPATPERLGRPWPTVETPVRNLLLTGSDVSSLGVVGAMFGGVLTAAHALGPLGLVRIMAAARALSRRQAKGPPERTGGP